jgi:hypothetical protein
MGMKRSSCVNRGSRSSGDIEWTKEEVFDSVASMVGKWGAEGSIRDGLPRMAQEGEKWVPGKLKPARADGLIAEGDVSLQARLNCSVFSFVGKIRVVPGQITSSSVLTKPPPKKMATKTAPADWVQNQMKAVASRVACRASRPWLASAGFQSVNCSDIRNGGIEPAHRMRRVGCCSFELKF